MSADESLSDASLAALSRADALSVHLPAPWPPTDIATLDRDELAADLRDHEALQRGLELAVVAVAELDAAADPSVRAELSRLARDEYAHMSFETGSVGDALQRRVLDGLGVDGLRIDWVRPHVDRGDRRVHLAVSLTRDDGPHRARACALLPSGLALARPLAPDWRAHVAAALRSTLADAGSPGALLEALLRALVPTTLAGRAAWLLTRGLALLGAGPDAPVAEATLAGRRFALHLLTAEHAPSVASYGLVRLLARLTTHVDGQLTDVREADTADFPLLAEDYAAAAPVDEADARAAVTLWRAAMQQHLQRVVTHTDGEPFLPNLLGHARPLCLLAAWVRGGPPGPAPRRPPPLAALDERHLAAAAARVRLLDPAATDALRERLDRQLLAALELDGWVALFCPWHRREPGTFEEDRICLVAPDGRSVAVLMNDPWNGHVMPIDGDAALFRVVARFWRELLARAGLDVAYTSPRTRDDEAAPDTSLLAWLEFAMPTGDGPRFPAIDWRVFAYGEDDDFIADFDFWGSGPFAMPPERRAAYQAAIASHYHSYIRAVIDPAFPRPPTRLE